MLHIWGLIYGDTNIYQYISDKSISADQDIGRSYIKYMSVYMRCLSTSSPPGDPPQAAAWLGQCGIYLLIMVLEKGVISLVLLVPGWSKVRLLVLCSGAVGNMASRDISRL